MLSSFGKIIKVTAIIILIIGIFASSYFCAPLVLHNNNETVAQSVGVLIFVGSIFGEWLLFLLLYGFGIIVEQIVTISKNSETEIKLSKFIAKTLVNFFSENNNDDLEDEKAEE